MLFKTGQIVKVRDVADPDYQFVVLQFVMMAIGAVHHFDYFSLERNPLDVALKKLHMLQQLSDRIHDVRHVQVRRSHFVKHRCKEEKIVSIDQSDFNIRIASDQSLYFERGVQPTEAASKNYNAFLH